MKEIQVHIGKRYKTAKATLAGVLIGDGTGGAVKSVNEKTGDVVLTAEDVGALSDEIKVPSKVSELVNDSRFMSDEEVVAKINEALSSVAGGLKFKVVDTIEDLPTWCDDSSTIYLVPSEKTESNQYYNEYLWMNGRWEKFGDTRVNLAPYYTELEVDNLIYNVQKSIPTKMSQLYNDAGYVKAKDIETGEATWDSLKGNILDSTEEFIEWDGNTEGLYTIGTGVQAKYKVSDRVIRGEDFQNSGMIITYDSGGSLGVASALTQTESNGQWYSTAYGVGCVFDSELAGHPEGIYFSAYNFSELGTPRKLGPFMNEKIKPEFLPDYVHEIPHFDLTEIGLPAIPIGQGLVRVETDTTEIMKAFERGSVKLSALASVGDKLVNATTQGTVAFDGNSYQCGAICYWQSYFVIVSVVVSDGAIGAIADVVYTMSIAT